MSFPLFDRKRLVFRPLSERANKVRFPENAISPDAVPAALSVKAAQTLADTVEKIRSARAGGRPVICAFGAHTIKNGLGPVLIRLIEDGWITHLATNGAGIIHDWELAFQGRTSEDVRVNVARGEFGIWEETGRYINLALLVGAAEAKGYGQSIGALIATQGLDIPSRAELHRQAAALLDADPERAAAAADLLAAVQDFDIPAAGWRCRIPSARRARRPRHTRGACHSPATR